MPLSSQEEVLGLKLRSIPKKQLQELAARLSVNNRGLVDDIIKQLLERKPDEQYVDQFLREEYTKRVERRRRISDDDLKNELSKVNEFSWGVVQGQLDRRIQSKYIRNIATFEGLVGNAQLHNDFTNYVTCAWFNHWTTELIEHHICRHERVVPTIKDVKGVDIFFDGQPFDLKITTFPRDHDVNLTLENPPSLAVWMYEEQGEQRFGAENRLFVVLLDKKNPEMSWELKRDFDLVFDSIDYFLDTEKVSSEDEIEFYFKETPYHPISKVLLITK
jgi:hypothetical protein